MSLAIDFTGSNGDPSSKSSLHFRNPNGLLNDYEQAITSVGSILEAYAFEGKFDVYGFGGIPSGKYKVDDCFSLTNKADAKVEGMSGVFNSYKNAISTTTLSGPT